MTDAGTLTTTTAAAEKALRHLREAHLLLLGNHGHLTQLTARQTRDLLGVGGGDDSLFMREAEHGEMNQCNARYLEAQGCLRRAKQELGIAVRDEELDHLAVPARWTDQLGGPFDAVVLEQIASNRQRNQRLAQEVRALHDEVRSSSPGLAVEPALASLSLSDERATLGERAADAVGLVTGSHPRFWTTAHWLFFGGGAVLVIGFVVVQVLGAGR